MDSDGDGSLSPDCFLSPEPLGDLENFGTDSMCAESDVVPARRRKRVLKSNHLDLNVREAFQCGICFKTLLTRSGIKVHLRTHSEVQNHKCDKCNQIFKSKSNLIDHRKRVHQNVNYTCRICQKICYYRSNLKKHLSKHCSTEKELDDLWEQDYSTEKTKQLSAAKKRRENAVQVNVSIVTDASTLELRPPPRNQRMKMGNFLTRHLCRYRNNLLYPKTPLSKLENMFHKDGDGNVIFTLSFANHECPLCPGLMLPRTRLLEHIDMKHNGNIVADNFCRVCLKTFQNIKAHNDSHVEMETVSLEMLGFTKNCLDPLMERPLFDEVVEIEKDRNNPM